MFRFDKKTKRTGAYIAVSIYQYLSLLTDQSFIWVIKTNRNNHIINSAKAFWLIVGFAFLVKFKICLRLSLFYVGGNSFKRKS